MGRTTLKQLAELAGLSVATVSRVVNGDDAVSPATRKRVLALAEQVGFRANRAARRLKTGQTHVIGFVLERDAQSDAFARPLLLGLTDVLETEQYHVVVKPEDPLNPMSTVAYFSDAQVADGLVITHTQKNDKRARWLIDQNVPFVSHGQTELGHDWVDFDNHAFAEQGCRALQGMGVERIGMIPPPRSLYYTEHLRHGFRAGGGTDLLGIDLSDNPALIYETVRAHGGAIDGWLLPDESLLLPVLGALSALGRLPGQGSQVVVKQFSQQTDFVPGEVLAADESLYVAGQQLGELLLRRLREPASAAQTRLLKPEFLTKGARYGI